MRVRVTVGRQALRTPEWEIAVSKLSTTANGLRLSGAALESTASATGHEWIFTIGAGVVEELASRLQSQASIYGVSVAVEAAAPAVA